MTWKVIYMQDNDVVMFLNIKINQPGNWADNIKSLLQNKKWAVWKLTRI